MAKRGSAFTQVVLDLGDKLGIAPPYALGLLMMCEREFGKDDDLRSLPDVYIARLVGWEGDVHHFVKTLWELRLIKSEDDGTSRLTWTLEQDRKDRSG